MLVGGMPEMVKEIIIWIMMTKYGKQLGILVRKLVEMASPTPERKADGCRDDCVSLAQALPH